MESAALFVRSFALSVCLAFARALFAPLVLNGEWKRATGEGAAMTKHASLREKPDTLIVLRTIRNTWEDLQSKSNPRKLGNQVGLDETDPLLTNAALSNFQTNPRCSSE